MLAIACAFAIQACSANGGANNSKTDNSQHCTGASCNTNNYPPDLGNCPIGSEHVELWHDNDGDKIPDCSLPSVIECLENGSTIPRGYTVNAPLCTDVDVACCDVCPAVAGNTCDQADLHITITATVTGSTVTILADPVYNHGFTTKVDFFRGVLLLGTDTNSSGGWSFTWTKVPAGTYMLSAEMTTNDGKTAFSNIVTVTVTSSGPNPPPTCATKMRCVWANANSAKLFEGVSSYRCWKSWNGQDPNAEWSTFRTCHDQSDGCIIEDEVFPEGFNSGECLFNITAPEGLGGNPANPFGQGHSWLIDWAVTSDGTATGYINALADGFPQCYISNDCATWAQVPVTPFERDVVNGTTVYHIWNFKVNFTGATNPQTGSDINIFVGSLEDSDGDGVPNACAPNTSCVPDNCIRYANPEQTITNPATQHGVGDACLNHKDPCDNDSDNDWYLDCEDQFPFDASKH